MSLRGRQLSEAVAEFQAGTQYRFLPLPELPAVSVDRHVVVGFVLDQPRGVVSSRRARLVVESPANLRNLHRQQPLVVPSPHF